MGSLGNMLASKKTPEGWNLNGKVALITGAGRGLGAGLAIMLAERGAAVVINYAASAQAAMSVVEQIEKNGGKAVAIQANISKTPEVTKLFEQAIAHFGRLDIVINNSGTEAFSAEEDVTEDLYDHVFGLNTRAQFFVGQHALKNLSSKFSNPVNIVAS
jgi:3-oxoacyl-[acyl-carrier protein] reductase